MGWCFFYSSDELESSDEGLLVQIKFLVFFIKRPRQTTSVRLTSIHSADLILFELVTIVEWFNPVVWFYKWSLREIQEFIGYFN